ncbi:hypothetical protein A0256_23760 [Mucilaginibacter sp. PAMC 26640]|nr:hypothetical protein A0256_23760 [Mucilaginibacter sp. PAMC 26640]
MRKFILLAMFIAIVPICKAQGCFYNEVTPTTTAICFDFKTGFDVSKMAADHINPNRYEFGQTQDSQRWKVPSWSMMDKEGGFYNIHRYGFDLGYKINICYKIIQSKQSVEIAILMNGEECYHGIIAIQYKKDDLFTAFDVSRTMLGKQTYPFTLVFKNGNDLEAFKYGDLFISKIR